MPFPLVRRSAHAVAACMAAAPNFHRPADRIKNCVQVRTQARTQISMPHGQHHECVDVACPPCKVRELLQQAMRRQCRCPASLRSPRHAMRCLKPSTGQDDQKNDQHFVEEKLDMLLLSECAAALPPRLQWLFPLLLRIPVTSWCACLRSLTDKSTSQLYIKSPMAQGLQHTDCSSSLPGSEGGVSQRVTTRTRPDGPAI